MAALLGTMPVKVTKAAARDAVADHDGNVPCAEPEPAETGRLRCVPTAAETLISQLP